MNRETQRKGEITICQICLKHKNKTLQTIKLQLENIYCFLETKPISKKNLEMIRTYHLLCLNPPLTDALSDSLDSLVRQQCDHSQL